MQDDDYDNKIDIKSLIGSSLERKKLCEYLFKNENLKSYIGKLVRKYDGNQTDGGDILNEAILRFFKSIFEKKEMDIHTNIINYMKGICSNVAKNFYKDKGKIFLDDEDIERIVTPDLLIKNDELKAVLDEVWEHTTEDCRSILQYWSQSYNMHEISKLMNYTSEGMARKKKYKCLKKLITFFKNNPNLTQKILGHE